MSVSQELIPVKPNADWGLTRGGAHCQWLWGCLAWSFVLTKSAPRHPRRSYAGGDQNDGGAFRKNATGLHFERGLLLRLAGVLAHLVVAATAAGMA